MICDAPNVSSAITSVSINEAAPLPDKKRPCGIRTRISRTAGKSFSFLGIVYLYRGAQHKYTELSGVPFRLSEYVLS